MSPKTRHTLAVAAVAVASAALCAIAAIQGWLPDWIAGPAATRVAATAPPESLSPGETVIPEKPKAPEPAKSAPASQAPAPSSAPAPATTPPVPPPEPAPAAKAPPPKPPAPPPRKPPVTARSSRTCVNCGNVSSVVYDQRQPRGAAWEIRVRFDDGNRVILRYPANPGFRVGDRVVFVNGRLQRG